MIASKFEISSLRDMRGINTFLTTKFTFYCTIALQKLQKLSYHELIIRSQGHQILQKTIPPAQSSTTTSRKPYTVVFNFH